MRMESIVAQRDRYTIGSHSGYWEDLKIRLLKDWKTSMALQRLNDERTACLETFSRMLDLDEGWKCEFEYEVFCAGQKTQTTRLGDAP